MKATVFDINRFAVHDGAGIRSTLFFKGCPLNCPWCQNPEGKKKEIALQYFARNCIRCGICVKTCPNHALSLSETGIAIDRQKCKRCGRCTEACPALALKLDGYRVDVQEAMVELLSDKLFYEATGGGVTLSGGEATLYMDFCYELLSACKEQGIDTAIETCLFADTQKLLQLAEVVDTFYADIKIADNAKHKKIIGVDNELILHNFAVLAQMGASIVARIPLIPGFTADEENLSAIATFIAKVNSEIPVELINYNPLAENKYLAFGLEYPIPRGTLPYSKVELAAFKAILTRNGTKKVL